jgi:hypothetical protein
MKKLSSLTPKDLKNVFAPPLDILFDPSLFVLKDLKLYNYSSLDIDEPKLLCNDQKGKTKISEEYSDNIIQIFLLQS